MLAMDKQGRLIFSDGFCFGQCLENAAAKFGLTSPS